MQIVGWIGPAGAEVDLHAVSILAVTFSSSTHGEHVGSFQSDLAKTGEKNKYTHARTHTHFLNTTTTFWRNLM